MVFVWLETDLEPIYLKRLFSPSMLPSGSLFITLSPSLFFLSLPGSHVAGLVSNPLFTQGSL